MVNAWNVTISVVVNIVCKLWARNIDHSLDGPSMMPRGGVKFELMVDTGMVDWHKDQSGIFDNFILWFDENFVKFRHFYRDFE